VASFCKRERGGDSPAGEQADEGGAPLTRGLSDLRMVTFYCTRTSVRKQCATVDIDYCYL
jgi:hypothetical protein